MIESKTNFRSVVARFFGLAFLVPVALAGCGSAGGGSHLGESASLGLANESADYGFSRPATRSSNAGRATSARRLSHKRKPTRVRAAKIIKRKSLKVAKVPSKPVIIPTSERRKSVDKKVKKAAVRQAVLKAREKASRKDTTKEVVIEKMPVSKRQVEKSRPQMVPAKVIPVQVAASDDLKSLSNLSKDLKSGAKATQKEGLKRTAKAAPAAIMFGFGHTAHRFSGRQ